MNNMNTGIPVDENDYLLGRARRGEELPFSQSPGIRVTEVDGNPDIEGITQLIFSNGTVTDNKNGSASISNSGGGGGGSIWPLTAIDNSGFAWRNQGGATVTTTASDAVCIVAPTSGGDNLRIREKNLPSAPYVITFAFVPLMPNANFYAIGMCLVESGSGEIVTLEYDQSSTLRATNWNSVTSYNASPYQQQYIGQTGMTFVQIEDDGANRIYRVSNDGECFLTVRSVANTDFCTPDKYGFFVNANNGSLGAIGAFYSLTVA